MTQRSRKLLLMAGGAWLALTVLATSFGPLSVGAIENRLQSQAEAELERRGLGWAHVEMDGQHAILSGAAPSDEARADARSVVLASTWSGGVVAGGITGVTDNMTNARLERGFAFRADMALRGRVLIRGDAPNANARDGISRFAENNFSSGADTDLTLVPGGAGTEAWEDAVQRLLGQLARLERGSVFLEGQQAGLVGDAANPQVARSVASTLSRLPEPYDVAMIVTPSGAPAEVSVENEAACRAVIRAAHGTDDLRFDREAASPSPMTETALRRMARVFSACPDNLRLNVAVAVADGGDALAAERRETVRGLLLAGGLVEDRLTLSAPTDAVQLITFEIEEIEG
ncbi:MAG: hypothetical protein GYB36_10320 [Alphaproteobacteria bacterium]|nr:hypothetical protein [Alphaproteobacteria bacterium]